MMPFLEALQKIAGVHATRPDIAGIMGAFGAALIARERHEADYKTTMLTIDQINELTYTTKLARLSGLYKPLSSDYKQILRQQTVHQPETAVKRVWARRRTRITSQIFLNTRTSVYLTMSHLTQRMLHTVQSASQEP